jgi:hypothetical protein
MNPKFGNVWKNGDIITDKEVFLRRVIYTNGLFIAPANNGKIFKSSNGVNWHEVDLCVGKNQHLFDIASDLKNSLIVCGRDNKIFCSTNKGINWKIVFNGKGTEDLYVAVYGNGMWIVIGENGTIIRSKDLVNWEVIPKKNSIRCGYFANGVFMFGCVNGNILKSKDGITFEKVFNANKTAIRGMTYGNGKWLAGGRTICISDDGVKWEMVKDLREEGIKDQIYCTGTAPDTFIVAGEHGLVYNSSDGKNWFKRDSGTRRFITGLAYGNNTLVGVGDGGKRTIGKDEWYIYSTHYSKE